MAPIDRLGIEERKAGSLTLLLAAAEKRGLFRFDPTRVAPIDRLGIEESSRKANIHTNRLLNDHRREVLVISLKVRTNRKADLGTLGVVPAPYRTQICSCTRLTYLFVVLFTLGSVAVAIHRGIYTKGSSNNVDITVFRSRGMAILTRCC